MIKEDEITLSHYNAIINSDAGAYCGAFGSNPHSFNSAKKCSEIKIEFAINLLNEIEKFEPCGDDYGENLHRTLDFIYFKKKQLQEILKLIKD